MIKQGIYCIENLITGKKYYGSSFNIEKRFKGHKKSLCNLKHHNLHLQRSVSKYGIDNFRFYIVEETNFSSKKDLYNLENTYINKNKNGYNIGSAGGGDNLSRHPNKDDIIKRRTQTMKDNLIALSEEDRAKRFEHCKGSNNGNWKNGGISTKICPKCNAKRIPTRYNTCGDCRNRSGKNNPFYGKKHSNETITKLQNNIPWTKNAKPEDMAYTKCYEITYADETTKIVYGLKIIAEEFNSSIANVAYTIERMKKKSYPTRRSRFYGIKIREINTV